MCVGAQGSDARPGRLRLRRHLCCCTFRSSDPATAMDVSSSSGPRVVFCEHCGSIMDEPRFVGANVDCRVCGNTVDATVFEGMVLQSASAEKIVEPDIADGVGRQKRTQARAVIKEPCPKCLHPELQYYTMQ